MNYKLNFKNIKKDNRNQENIGSSIFWIEVLEIILKVKKYFYFDQKQTRKIKESQQKLFPIYDTYFNNIYCFIQFYSNYLKAGR